MRKYWPLLAGNPAAPVDNIYSCESVISAVRALQWCCKCLAPITHEFLQFSRSKSKEGAAPSQRSSGMLDIFLSKANIKSLTQLWFHQSVSPSWRSSFDHRRCFEVWREVLVKIKGSSVLIGSSAGSLMPRLWHSEEDKVWKYLLSCCHFITLWLPLYAGNTKVCSLAFLHPNNSKRWSLCDSWGRLLHQPITLWSRHYPRGITKRFNKRVVIWAAFGSAPTALIRFGGKQTVVARL